jgi:hypothetical protein
MTPSETPIEHEEAEKLDPYKLPDPYKGVKADDILRSSINIGMLDVSHIRKIYPKEGVLQSTINKLFHEFVNELKRNKLNDYDPSGYVIALNGLSINLGGLHKVLTGVEYEPATNVETGEHYRPTSGTPIAQRTPGAERPSTAEAAQGHDGPRGPKLARVSYGR